MTQQIGLLEIKFAEYATSSREPYTPMFLYNRSYKDLCRRFEELPSILDDPALEVGVRDRGWQLVEAWNAFGKKQRIPPPPIHGISQKTILSEVLVWTLNQRGFTMSSWSDSDDVTYCEVEQSYLSLVAHLRVLPISGSHLVAYLDQFVFKTAIGSIDFFYVPLRFDLACIQPMLTGVEPPALPNLPREVLVIVLEYMRLEEMGEACLTSASLKSAFDSDELWIHVHACFSSYVNGPKPPTNLTDAPGTYKTAISNVIRDRQARREMSFARSGTLDDWGGRLSYIDSRSLVMPVRQRRLDFMDDIDLFM
jgi:hypothetical protein